MLLISSGIGSALARVTWLPRRIAFGTLLGVVFLLPIVLPQFIRFSLILPNWGRLGFSFVCLAPLGVLMGLPFPLGIIWLQERANNRIPFVWAVNGCASVIASVMAAIISLSYGFRILLFLGAGAYAGAALIYIRFMKEQ